MQLITQAEQLEQHKRYLDLRFCWDSTVSEKNTNRSSWWGERIPKTYLMAMLWAAVPKALRPSMHKAKESVTSGESSSLSKCYKVLRVACNSRHK